MFVFASCLPTSWAVMCGHVYALHVPYAGCRSVICVCIRQYKCGIRLKGLLLSCMRSRCHASPYHTLRCSLLRFGWLPRHYPCLPCQPADKLFQNTGLERTAALTQDLEWFKQTYDIAVHLKEDSAGHTYVQLLRKLAAEDQPAFICHYYNFYFAHTAGGRMIGSKVSSNLGQDLQL